MVSPRTAIFHQALTVFPMYLLSGITGLTMGWLPIALYYLRSATSTLPITAEQGAWMASMQSFGRLFAALPAGIATDIVGRRTVSLTAAVIYLVTWIVIPLTRSYAILCVCNLLLGIGVALVNVANQMHMSEVVSADHRGSFHAINGFFHNFGILFIATTGVYLSYSTVCYVNAAVVLLYFSNSYWLVESPYYLLFKGERHRAEWNFLWLRAGIAESEQRQEFAKIESNIEFQKTQQEAVTRATITSTIRSKFVKPLADPVNRRCVFVVLALNFLVILTGNVAIKLNSSFIFTANAFVQNKSKFQWAISCVQFVASFFAFFVIEKFRRRTLFIGASLIVSAILIVNGLCFYLSERTDLAHYWDATAVATVCFAATLVYYGFYTVTLHSLVNMQRCELLPQNVKAIGTGLAILTQAGSSSLSILLFQYVLDAAGIYPNFILFTVSGLLMAFFIYRSLPEVKGLTLAEVYDSMSSLINRS